VVGVDDFTPITGEVTDGRVELGKADTHEKRMKGASLLNADNSQRGLALYV
jgi:hypothetical protein